jgi:hypothetical protein
MLVFEPLSHSCNLISNIFTYLLLLETKYGTYLKVTFYILSYIIASAGLCSSLVDQNNWYFVTSYIFGQKSTYLLKKKVFCVLTFWQVCKKCKIRTFKINFQYTCKNHQSFWKSFLFNNLTCFNNLTVWSTLFSKIAPIFCQPGVHKILYFL